MWSILRHTCLNIIPPPNHVVHLQAHMSQHYLSAAPCGPSSGTHVSPLPLRRTMWSISRHTCLTITPPPHHVVHLQAHMSQHYPFNVPMAGARRCHPEQREGSPRCDRPPERVLSGGGAIASKIWSGYLFTSLFHLILPCPVTRNILITKTFS